MRGCLQIRFALLTGAGWALLSGSLVSAQETSPSPPDDADTQSEVIVVEGARTDREAALEQARDITRPARRRQPLERFHLPVCPNVVGFDDGTAAVIADRIRENARAAGLSVGGENCQKNILVGVFDDIEGQTERLMDEERWAFGNMQDYQRERVKREKGPTRAWHVSVKGDSKGIALVSFDGEVPVVSSFGGSRIAAQSTKLIEASVVLIERSAIAGKTLRQIADFATLRALVPVNEVDPEEGAGLDTILALFGPDNGPGGPAGLTEFDRAYLEGYYAGNAAFLDPSALMSNIARKFARDLAQEQRENEAAE